MNNIRIEDTFSYNLIYVFRINDDAHKGLLKVGKTTIKFDEPVEKIVPNHKYLRIASKKRIDSYTKTAGIEYEYLYSELAINNKGKPFNDTDVHRVLINSGIKKKLKNNGANEWFKTDLETVRNAIKAVKEGKSSLSNKEITQDRSPIVLRPSQRDAADKTIKQFKKSNKMLWNAKMRFGKTLTALQVIKEMKLKKTIIITHRPVVDEGWFEDFNMVFYDTDYHYGSKSKDHGDTIENLYRNYDKYIYFASIQDLRGSAIVGGKYDKNDLVFNINWDLVIIDEAHEGTETLLGQDVIKNIVKEDSEYTTKVLFLSGTPFNLLDEFEPDEVYTWDYIMEQKAKQEWYLNHYGDPNPYEDLPKMHIYTYNLDEQFKNYNDVEDMAFNFREFFRVWTGDASVDRRIMPSYARVGEFVHEEDVRKFLNLLCKEDENSHYPFSNDKFREYFRHSLWMIPGVKEAKALSKLLHEHPVFGSAFEIINVAGEGDDFEEKHLQDAKKMVDDAITDHPEDTYTITLSCGRLTTGVSIKAWTAVLMLYGSANISAQSYLQTIFRAQTPAYIGDRVKDSCYVFDFAPDRTLKMVARASQLSIIPGRTDTNSRELAANFLNYCPVIGINGSSMEAYNVDRMMQQLKKVYADHVVRNGFDDRRLYNEDLLRLDDLEIEEFNKLGAIVGSTKSEKAKNQIDINKQGLTDEEWETIKESEHKTKSELTLEEKEALKRLKEAREMRSKAISILRGISIRIPMLIYGADIDLDEDITINKFLEIVDDISWEEFMPAGVTKDLFKQFSKYYDVDVFIEAGRRIRHIAKSADKLNPTERVKKIADLFNTFKNPDKETVLTPWRVVNMHMSDTLGGWCFYDRTFDETYGRLDQPIYVSQGETSINTIATSNSRILEINSKSGLYPLYITYSIYRQRCLNCDTKKLDEAKEKELWKKTLQNNVYVVCKTRMASSITKRTLFGYNENIDFNILTYENIVDLIKNNLNDFAKELNNPATWGKEGKSMKFSAVVGNPPYQEEGSNTRKSPIYHYFYDLSFALSKKVTLISPARFLFDAGQTPKKWNSKMLNDNHFKVVHFYPNSKEIFNTVDIKGGVVITMRDSDYNYGEIGTFTPYEELNSILQKIYLKEGVAYNSLSDIISSRGLYRFTKLYFEENPDASKKLGDGTGNMIVTNVFEKLKDNFIAEQENNQEYYKFIGLFNKNRTYRYILKKYVIENDYVKSYNVLLPKSNGSGKFGESLSSPTICKINEGATDTFISIGTFLTEYEANSALKYIKTKFSRALLGIKKRTQDNAKSVWQYIPIQNFTPNSDIDWTKSIHEIDLQLYKKYGLSDNEIAFIEEKVVEMK